MIGIGLMATPSASGSEPPIAAPTPTPGLARQAHSRRGESSAQIMTTPAASDGRELRDGAG
jgi:hypothetical protein